MNTEVKLYQELTENLIDEMLKLDEQIFPRPLSREKLTAELAAKNNISVFIAYLDKRPVGFKVGFERSKRIYYSWIGGVLSDYRQQGIAQVLMKQQHEHAAGLGYKVVCTQTDNSFKPMIILNLKSGFGIRGTIQSHGDDFTTIIMEKNFT